MKIEVVNMVGKGDFKHRVDLLKLAELDNVRYNMDINPHIAFIKVKPHLVANIYYTGKVMVWGAKTEEELAEACTEVENVVNKIL